LIISFILSYFQEATKRFLLIKVAIILKLDREGFGFYSDPAYNVGHGIFPEPKTETLREVYPEPKTEILRGVYPAQRTEILRFAQDDQRGAQDDSRRRARMTSWDI
jgi:hypothetical protein